jgi:3D (Asp-Asp-Asp) domain-containing protein
MKRQLGAIILTAAVMASALAAPAAATEQAGLDLIRERENRHSVFAESVDDYCAERVEAAHRAAEEARRAAERERQEKARRAAVVSTAATDESYEGAVYLGVCEVTAYCACSICCGKSDGITATGTKATQGRTVAVDPSVIPYGSVVIINGHEYIAEDCGGGIGGTQIDMFFNSHQDALNWGRRWLDVWVRY